MIFGSTAGDDGQSGKLVLRTIAKGLASAVKDGQELGHPNFSTPAYLTFPIQSREKGGQKTQYAGRGVLTSGSFGLAVIWRGNAALWGDIKALIAIFGHLGALGFRGRRAMGAVAFARPQPLDLPGALSRFSSPEAICVKKLHATSPKDAISGLGAWLKSCRAHGRSGQNQKEQQCHYFKFAERDHDIGYNLPATRIQPAFRPALGLPIIQRTRSGTNSWDWDWDAKKEKAKGRFASPVLLRPHRDAQGNWHALVIFVDAHKWPDGKLVFLNGKERQVAMVTLPDGTRSPALYEAMKNDNALKPFTG